MEKTLLSGNEAIAQGAWEAGVSVGVGYPGTPSTETLERFGKLPGTYAEWAPNEKVALETGMGVSLAGGRALVTMKHVGVNVAADPLMSIAYTGVNGGLVLLAADDPGIYSSQNEQDSRNYAAFARVPMFEPSDSQEALDFTKLAFDISEKYDTLVMLRSTVRISHTKTPVEYSTDPVAKPLKTYQKDAGKYVMMPANAKRRRKDADTRCIDLVDLAETIDVNVEEMRDDSIGIICSGAVYQHVREAMPDASTFKLGMSFPLPPKRLSEFAAKVGKCYVVEEDNDFFATHLKALGVPILPTPNPLPPDDELTPDIVRCAFDIQVPEHPDAIQGLPPRPPALCPGCPHRLVYAELRRIHATVCGDIGCYTLGALAPLSSIDSCVCMGASVSMAHGMELMRMLAPTQDEADGKADAKNPIVGVIGDSTFAHSGITSLLTSSYNNCKATILILDNRTTAMTGQQGNPVNGITLQNRPTRELDLEKLCEAVGVEDVVTVDSYDSKAIRKALKAATSADHLSVIICKHPCVLLTKFREKPYTIDADKCTACGTCVSLGCPSLGKDPVTGKAHLDPTLCCGCGQCTQYCAFGAISPAKEA